MGLHGNRDQGIVAPFGHHLFGVGETGLDGTVIGGREVVQDFPDHRPHAGLVSGFGHGVLEKIHVAETGGAGQDHFSTGQQGAGFDLVVIEPGFGRENMVLEPVHQRQVVGHAAKTGHGRMGMGVDQPGQDDAAFGIQGSRGRPGGGFRHGTGGGDLGSVDGQVSGVEFTALGIHGQEPGIDDQDVGVFHLL